MVGMCDRRLAVLTYPVLHIDASREKYTVSGSLRAENANNTGINIDASKENPSKSVRTENAHTRYQVITIAS